uniref:Uncharacterized protein n=1 Tax=Solanum tuberosum TaxID=4113 RepID=M0ZYG0_SOLTU
MQRHLECLPVTTFGSLLALAIELLSEASDRKNNQLLEHNRSNHGKGLILDSLIIIPSVQFHMPKDEIWP